MNFRGRDINVSKFWERIKKGAPDECWPWQGATFPSGYGVFTVKRNAVRAHRIAYYLFKGEIPAGMAVCHHCDNKPCCNPRHLFGGTQLENVADRNRKGRTACGENAGRAKLTPSQVIAIRDDPREQREIAKDYGVCKSTIGYLKRGESWSSVQ